MRNTTAADRVLIPPTGPLLRVATLPPRARLERLVLARAVRAPRGPRAGRRRADRRLLRRRKAAPAGFEPAARCLEGSRSVQRATGALVAIHTVGRRPRIDP